jgi:hypothetical protein
MTLCDFDRTPLSTSPAPLPTGQTPSLPPQRVGHRETDGAERALAVFFVSAIALLALPFTTFLSPQPRTWVV